MTLRWPDNAALRRLDELLGHLTGACVAVVGLGVAGQAMARLLTQRGAVVVGIDRSTTVDRAALATCCAELRLGTDATTSAALDGVRGVALSPGVDPRQELISTALARSLPVFGELELSGRFSAPVAAITGTNGKSTTTALTGALVQAVGARAFVGGNLGEPICEFVASGEAVDAVVLELSSFQLESAYRFAPRVAVILNLAPDHGERYDRHEDYVAAKRNLVRNLGASDFAVLNADDAATRAFADGLTAQVRWFSTRATSLPGQGAWLDPHSDRVRASGACALLDGFELAHPRLLGRHNRENALAALLAVQGLGLVRAETLAALRAGYLAFAGLEHRLELAGEWGGVQYVNDSKATNDDAAAIGAGAMTRPTILLLGGVDKGGGYEAVKAASRAHVKTVIAYGAAREVIAQAFAGDPRLVVVATFGEALAAAVTRAKSGDTVLLSPACSSFDEFKNYKERGVRFKQTAARLAGGAQ